MAAIGLWAQQAGWFPYPVPPESMPLGRARANYMVEHFWDHCPWKSAYSSTARMESAMRDFADFLPIAAPDTVHLSIAKLIKESQKKPADFEKLLLIAESTFNSDSAAIFSDEVFYPFVEAASTYKKFKAEQREPYSRKARIIATSSEGKTLPALKASRRDGSSFALNDTTSGASSYVIILETPGDAGGRFDRVRFSANVAARRLIESGLLKPILLSTVKANEDWWKSTENLPQEWEVGEMPEAGEYFDLRMRPAIYMLDPRMEVISKWMHMQLLINNCEQLVRYLESQQQQKQK